MTYEPEPVSTSEALGALREHWGSAYTVTVSQGGAEDVWTAVRHSDGTILTAASAWELRTLLRRHHGVPGPRHG